MKKNPAFSHVTKQDLCYLSFFLFFGFNETKVFFFFSSSVEISFLHQ